MKKSGKSTFLSSWVQAEACIHRSYQENTLSSDHSTPKLEQIKENQSKLNQLSEMTSQQVPIISRSQHQTNNPLSMLQLQPVPYHHTNRQQIDNKSKDRIKYRFTLKGRQTVGLCPGCLPGSQYSTLGSENWLTANNIAP